MARSTHLRHPWRHRVAVAVATLTLVLPAAASAKQFSAWGPADPVGAVNSAAADGCPIESPNGLELYIASNRTGNVGGAGDPNDIWRSTREAVDAEWSPPVNLGATVNSGAADFCPTPLNGGWLLFVSARGGPQACGVAPAGDIYITREHPVRAWETPRHLGCAPAGPAGIIGPFVGDIYVPSDPCAWTTTMQDLPGTTVDEVVAALQSQAFRDASEPVGITVDGHAGKSITLQVPDDAALDDCDLGKFCTLTQEDPAVCHRYQQFPGQTDEVWILDVNGEVAVIDAT